MGGMSSSEDDRGLSAEEASVLRDFTCTQRAFAKELLRLRRKIPRWVRGISTEKEKVGAVVLMIFCLTALHRGGPKTWAPQILVHMFLGGFAREHRSTN